MLSRAHNPEMVRRLIKLKERGPVAKFKNGHGAIKRLYPARKLTIKEFACERFVSVNYVDVYGRNIGYDYEFILAEIKKKFPEAKTSKRWLRMMAYELNNTARIPARRRSRRALAEGYAEALLLQPEAKTYRNITRAVRRKFDEQRITSAELRRVEQSLLSRGFTVPARI
jgi:hypothetical protein